MSTNRALWDRELSRVVQYPRGDDQDVVQLNMERYLPLTIVRETAPEPVDGFQAVAVRSVDLEAAEWRWGWELVAIPPPPPPGPDYQGFYQALLVSGVYAAVLGQDATADLARALAVFVSAIQDALNGRVNEAALQGAIWLLLSKLLLQPESLAELQGLMVQFNLDGVYSLFPMPAAETLGQTWTGPDGSEWVVVQVRNADGTFAEDDPATPERESLRWERVEG
jgi:hypothetical protein